MVSQCPRCGAAFECSPADGACWCTELPPLLMAGYIHGKMPVSTVPGRAREAVRGHRGNEWVRRLLKSQRRATPGNVRGAKNVISLPLLHGAAVLPPGTADRRTASTGVALSHRRRGRHRRKKLAVVAALGDILPFIIGRHPRALPTPTMEVGKDLRAYLVRRELTDDRERDRPLELVQHLVRQAGARSRTDTARRHLELIAFTDTPRLEDRLWNNHAQGVSDASNSDFHVESYNMLSAGDKYPASLRT